MTALRGLEDIWLGVKKHERIEKVTGSQDDKGEGSASMVNWLVVGRTAGQYWLRMEGTAGPSTARSTAYRDRRDRSASLPRRAGAGGMTRGSGASVVNWIVAEEPRGGIGCQPGKATEGKGTARARGK
jgi:hypothetical protein